QRNPGGRLLTECTSNHSPPTSAVTWIRVPFRRWVITSDDALGAACKGAGFVTRYHAESGTRGASVGPEREEANGGGVFSGIGAAAATAGSGGGGDMALPRSSTNRLPSRFSQSRIEV